MSRNFHKNSVNTTFGNVNSLQTVGIKKNKVHETLHLRKWQK